MSQPSLYARHMWKRYDHLCWMSGAWCWKWTRISCHPRFCIAVSSVGLTSYILCWAIFSCYWFYDEGTNLYAMPVMLERTKHPLSIDQHFMINIFLLTILHYLCFLLNMSLAFSNMLLTHIIFLIISGWGRGCCMCGTYVQWLWNRAWNCHETVSTW